MKSWKPKPSTLCWIAGLIAIFFYWLSVRPLGQGYAQDMCNHQMARQIMAENISQFGRPVFHSSNVMAPYGLPGPFFAGWNVERDWIGSYVFKWNRDFPFLWVYYGLSLLACYLGVGRIISHMGLPGAAAWLVSATVVLFNLPRHFKLWHHSDNVMMHWVYLGFFLDAWIWQRFIKDRKWSLTLEIWRGLILLGGLNVMGYFWGPSIIEWVVVHGSMGWVVLARVGKRPKMEFSLKSVLPAFALGIPLLIADLTWFLELASAAKQQGEISQAVGYFVHGLYLIRPIWVDSLAALFQWDLPFPPLDAPETVASIGWLYLVPLAVALFYVRKGKKGPGYLRVAPFVIVFMVAVFYVLGPGVVPFFVPLVQDVVPFMKFFRTAARFTLFLPPLATIIIVLAWPQVMTFARSMQKKRRAWVILFLATSGLEFTWILAPVNQFPPPPEHLLGILGRVKQAPGDTVLSLPFCVHGANGVCGPEQCFHHPEDTLGGCMRIWHDKKVFGAYTARMNDSDCNIYRRAPYSSWFAAWKEHRCLSDNEWGEFCTFLETHSQLSAVLVFPDLWAGANTEKCQEKFKEHLGDPIDSVQFMGNPTRGGEGSDPTRLFWYAPHCTPKSAHPEIVKNSAF